MPDLNGRVLIIGISHRNFYDIHSIKNYTGTEKSRTGAWEIFLARYFRWEFY